MLVAYDVSTETPAGRRRVRRGGGARPHLRGAGGETGVVGSRGWARACLDSGQRVQKSVFECEVEPAQWVALRARLVAEIDSTADSLRFYRLGAGGRRRGEHRGGQTALDPDGA